MLELNGDGMVDIVQIIANDKKIIPYRPELNVLTGGNVVATILLQQVIYWWYKNGRERFYKFRTKPEKPNKLYKEGDSWCEELGISGKVFDTALRTIGFKMGKKRNTIKKDEAYVWYYTDRDRITWYILNEELLYKALKGIYPVIPKKEITDIIPAKEIIKVPEITTENTTETLYSSSFDERETENHLPSKSKENNTSIYKDTKASRDKETKEQYKKLLEKYFERYWSAEPRKVDKDRARRASMAKFGKLKEFPVANFDAYMNARIAEAEVKKAEHGNLRFLKHPATWINATDFTSPPSIEELEALGLVEETIRWERADDDEQS